MSTRRHGFRYSSWSLLPSISSGCEDMVKRNSCFLLSRSLPSWGSCMPMSGCVVLTKLITSQNLCSCRRCRWWANGTLLWRQNLGQPGGFCQWFQRRGLCVCDVRILVCRHRVGWSRGRRGGEPKDSASNSHQTSLLACSSGKVSPQWLKYRTR